MTDPNPAAATVAGKVALADVKVNRSRGGQMRVLLSPGTARATSGFLGVLTLASGDFVAEHYHPYSEEFLYVIDGAVTVRLDGVPVALRAREGLLIPKNTRHRVENHDEPGAELVFHLCPLAPRPELGHVNTEPLPAAGGEQVTGG